MIKMPPMMRCLVFSAFMLLLHPAFVSATECLGKSPCSTAKGISFLSKITPSGQEIDDVFGASTEIDNKTAIIGAPWDSKEGYHSGAVYVYENTNKGWKQTTRLQPQNPSSKALFGSSIALKGDKLLVGAPGERQGKLTSAGAVYVFIKNAKGVWEQQARLTAETTQAGDFFGNAVAWAGEDAVVGVHLHDGKAIDAGAVYVFRKQTDVWQQVALLEPTDNRAGTLFGNALDADDTRIIVGAYGHEGQSPSGGAVYIYTKNKGEWKFSSLLQPSVKRAFAEFGWSVALSGNHLIVGAPYEDQSNKAGGSGAAYVFQYDEPSSKWIEKSHLVYADNSWQERFGASVAFIGKTALVSAPYGVAYLFTPSPTGGYTQTGKLVGNYPASGNLFSRTLSSDGKTLLVGVPSLQNKDSASGTAYFFSVTAATPSK